ncbi:MAG: M20/M25/M40 family metallo-hydrolase [Bacteriovoracaceae bacterium]|jgi:leucyl aminopeptidase|nr:aminopeptidase [Halobacteriovoraceae bacterium]MDP7319433.1 M20/M25/M40 family metallo-hydrolase [Bacteriovoracaceae bacterium]
MITRFLILMLFPWQAQANDLYLNFASSTQLPKSLIKSDTYNFVKQEELTFLKLSSQKELQSFLKQVRFPKKYCGGFVVSKSALSLKKKKSSNIYDYTISRPQLTKRLLKSVNEQSLYQFIKKFSSYHTRYYTAQTGIKALKDLAQHWQNIISIRSDANIKFFKHPDWPQPSVILTFKGKSSQKIITGGHADSINTDDEGKHSLAPGADDNASGISVITEIIRVLVNHNYKPKNTLVFMAYAAEEVGLQGSMEIAKTYYENKEDVLGVIQFDGTNFNGSDIKFALINDNTNADQNKFIGNLIDEYLNVAWGYDQCQYACSDHYSWDYYGFKASFPAEARIAQENPRIHTEEDTLKVSNYTADHAVHFAKLGLAYIIELDK